MSITSSAIYLGEKKNREKGHKNHSGLLKKGGEKPYMIVYRGREGGNEKRKRKSCISVGFEGKKVQFSGRGAYDKRN